MNFNLVINDDEVEGMIRHRSSSDISVRIVSPYQHLTMGLHIPYFSRSYTNFDGEYGDKTSESLLRKIYSICQHVDTEILTLKEQLLKAEENIKNLPFQFSNEDFAGQRKELKGSMKRGELTSTSYQKRLHVLRKQNNEFNRNINRIFDDFFQDGFPMCIPYDTRRRIINMINE